MNQQSIILIEAGTPDFDALKRAIAYAEETESYIRFFLEPATSEEVFERGDLIEANTDYGWKPARVASVSSDGVGIDYGPGFKHHTTVSRYSVRTDKRKDTPACLKVKPYEQEWSLGMESHRPNGGY